MGARHPGAYRAEAPVRLYRGGHAAGLAHLPQQHLHQLRAHDRRREHRPDQLAGRPQALPLAREVRHHGVARFLLRQPRAVRPARADLEGARASLRLDPPRRGQPRVPAPGQRHQHADRGGGQEYPERCHLPAHVWPDSPVRASGQPRPVHRPAGAGRQHDLGRSGADSGLAALPRGRYRFHPRLQLPVDRHAQRRQRAAGALPRHRQPGVPVLVQARMGRGGVLGHGHGHQ
ncbi:hypothetical protein D3C81_1432210 [compost metagenome]